MSLSVTRPSLLQKIGYLVSIYLETHVLIYCGTNLFRIITSVDSIKWVRSDCIILGCFQLSEDGIEENYFVQVIKSKHGKITDVSD